MKVTGSAVLAAPIERVFAALHDPAVLVQTIPGVERLEEVGPDRYRVTVTAGVASIKGAYAGEVALTDQQPPSSFRLTARGAGAPGTVQADVEVRLSPDSSDGSDSPDGSNGSAGSDRSSGTRVAYSADAVVGGVVGGVGQRVLAGVAKKTAAEFFGNVDDVLTGRRAPVEPSGVTAAADAPAVAAVLAPGGAAPSRSASDSREFLRGTLVGAAIALAGVVVGAAISPARLRRRGRRG